MPECPADRGRHRVPGLGGAHWPPDLPDAHQTAKQPEARANAVRLRRTHPQEDQPGVPAAPSCREAPVAAELPRRIHRHQPLPAWLRRPVHRETRVADRLHHRIRLKLQRPVSAPESTGLETRAADRLRYRTHLKLQRLALAPEPEPTGLEAHVPIPLHHRTGQQRCPQAASPVPKLLNPRWLVRPRLPPRGRRRHDVRDDVHGVCARFALADPLSLLPCLPRQQRPPPSVEPVEPVPRYAPGRPPAGRVATLRRALLAGLFLSPAPDCGRGRAPGPDAAAKRHRPAWPPAGAHRGACPARLRDGAVRRAHAARRRSASPVRFPLAARARRRASASDASTDPAGPHSPAPAQEVASGSVPAWPAAAAARPRLPAAASCPGCRWARPSPARSS